MQRLFTDSLVPFLKLVSIAEDLGEVSVSEQNGMRFPKSQPGAMSGVVVSLFFPVQR